MATVWKLIKLPFCPANRWWSSKRQVSLFRELSSVLPWPQVKRMKVILWKYGRHFALHYLGVTVCWLWHVERNHKRFVVKVQYPVLGGSGKIVHHMSYHQFFKTDPCSRTIFGLERKIFLKDELSFALSCVS